MSKKLEILKQSLAKKEQELQRRFDVHFATVKQANGQPPLQQCSVSCWACRYCDKESVLKGDKWVLTRIGYCLAEKSAVNGKNDFYKKVYVNTTYNECSQFEPCR